MAKPERIEVDYEYIERTVRRFAEAEGVDEDEIQRRIANVAAHHEGAVRDTIRDLGSIDSAGWED